VISYSEAIKRRGGGDCLCAEYDCARDGFLGHIISLSTANDSLKGLSWTIGLRSNADVVFQGDVSKWRKICQFITLEIMYAFIQKKTYSLVLRRDSVY